MRFLQLVLHLLGFFFHQTYNASTHVGYVCNTHQNRKFICAYTLFIMLSVSLNHASPCNHYISFPVSQYRRFGRRFHPSCPPTNKEIHTSLEKSNYNLLHSTSRPSLIPPLPLSPLGLGPSSLRYKKKVTNHLIVRSPCSLLDSCISLFRQIGDYVAVAVGATGRGGCGMSREGTGDCFRD